MVFSYISRALSVFIFSGGPIGRSELNGSKYVVVSGVNSQKIGKFVGHNSQKIGKDEFLLNYVLLMKIHLFMINMYFLKKYKQNTKYGKYTKTMDFKKFADFANIAYFNEIL